MKIKFKKFHPDAIVPSKKNPWDVGYDMVAVECKEIYNNVFSYNTGIGISIPPGFGGFLFPRSSVTKTNMRLANCVGVIDPSYHESIYFMFDMRDTTDTARYNIGDKIGQIVLMQVELMDFEEDVELKSIRGGWGSTGN